MAYEPKAGNFSLFKNTNKTSDKAPDYRGDGLDLDGNEIQVAAWIKQGKNGAFMSCLIQPKQERPKSGFQNRNKAKSEFDDDIPF